MIDYRPFDMTAYTAALQVLAEALPRKDLEEDLMEVSEPIAAAMSQAAPKLTGRYARSIKARIAQPYQPQQARVLIGPGGPGKGGRGKSSHAYKGFWLEYGTYRLAARPHLRPTFEAMRVNAMRALRGRLDQRLTAAARSGRVFRVAA